MSRRTELVRAVAGGVALVLAPSALEAWNTPVERLAPLVAVTVFYTTPAMVALLYIWGYLPTWTAPSILKHSKR